MFRRVVREFLRGEQPRIPVFGEEGEDWGRTYSQQGGTGIVTFNTTEKVEYTLVEFNIQGGAMEPSDLKQVVPPQVDPRRGVIISGRGPVWLYSFLTHQYHYVLWVATFDPRVGGGVVVATHTKKVQVGDVVPV